VSSGVVGGVTRHNTPIHNIQSTAQLSISQKALGTLPKDGNVMPKHADVGFSRTFLLGILILKGLTARRLYKSLALKG
jgi:hypothetical protein